jgi:serine/threonine protein phosphatase PrpC
VLCSDGFWNYHWAPDAVASLVLNAGARSSPAHMARRLVGEALARGGQDNATVLVYRHE